MKTRRKVSLELSSLPECPGVYLFYGIHDELLYVGKSKSIRTRVRSHFAVKHERRLCRSIRRIETRQTAGELGALLLESQLIKEQKPMFNVASKRRRRIVIARRVDNAEGYATIHLDAIDYLQLDASRPILGIFKHKTQAKEFLAQIAKTHRLCPKLLRLEQSRTYCFSYHLGQCSGACMAEEDAPVYNARVDEAFGERRIKAWPFNGTIQIEESSPDGSMKESFIIDNWCLLESTTRQNGKQEPFLQHTHRFDYDSYKILLAFITSPDNKDFISVLPSASR
ncbi:MAG: GIY-YIG nuclease family protein [bacterium]